MIVGWKAWFVDVPHQHSTLSYSSRDNKFEDLPQDGCLGIITFEDNKKPDGFHKRGMLSGYDYYFKAGEIYGVDVETREKNAVEDIKKRYVDPCIIRGIWASDDMMKAIQAEMRAEQWL